MNPCTFGNKSLGTNSCGRRGDAKHVALLFAEMAIIITFWWRRKGDRWELLHFSHLEGFVDNFSHLEGFVDNITDIWIHPLGVVSNFCLESGGSEGVVWRLRLTCRLECRVPSSVRRSGTSSVREKTKSEVNWAEREWVSDAPVTETELLGTQ